MNHKSVLIAIVVSALITFFLRAVPFIVFRKDRTMPPKFIYLGKVLPSAIMAVLVVYCLKDVVGDFGSYGIAELVATAVVIVTYKWKHSTFISICAGTICNMILLQI